MKVTDFAAKVTIQEGLRKSTNIAQVAEVLKIVNNLLDGELYSLIKKHANVIIVNPKQKAVKKIVQKNVKRIIPSKNIKSIARKRKS